jgi:thymidylate synthase (FAD)
MESQSFGFVRLDSCMADDISVVNSARVSFAKSQQEMDESAKGLINFLMREKHGTPFEHNAFRFHVKCPVFVAREWFRHRIGSFNEFSARYSEVGEDFFVPYQNDVRSQVGKPGAYEFHMVEEEIADQAIGIISQANSIAYESYKKLIDIGIAKELSRTVLPVGMYTQFYWTVNARSLMNFLSLRLSKTAQLDIRRYAKSVEAIFADKMPVTYKAWVENGMNCP